LDTSLQQEQLISNKFSQSETKQKELEELKRELINDSITKEFKDDVFRSLVDTYPCVVRDDVEKMFNDNIYIVIKSKDYTPGGQYKPEATKLLVNGYKEADKATLGYDFRNSEVLSKAPYVPADILLIYTSPSGPSNRVNWDVKASFDNLELPLKLLVDTGSPITYLLLDEPTFKAIQGVMVMADIRGFKSQSKTKIAKVYIDDEEAGTVKTVYNGGTFAPYLAGQFPSCRGILGMDLLRNCQFSLSKGKTTIIVA